MILIGYNLFGLCDVACYVDTEPQTGRDTVGLTPGRGCRHLKGERSGAVRSPVTLNSQQGVTRVNYDRTYGHGKRVTPAPVQGLAALGVGPRLDPDAVTVFRGRPVAVKQTRHLAGGAYRPHKPDRPQPLTIDRL